MSIHRATSRKTGEIVPIDAMVRRSRVAIRPAVSRDAAGLQKLNRAFNGDDTAMEWIRNHLRSTRTSERVFVAVGHHTLIGFCCVSITTTFCHTARRAEVTELFVLPGHRRRGIARRLLVAATQLARDVGASDIVLLTNARNTPARAFYEGLGFRKDADVLYRRSFPDKQRHP